MQNNMKLKMSFLLYCLLIILPIYQDSPLSKYLGSTGESMMPAISLIGVSLCILIRGKLAINKTIKGLGYLGIWLLLVSFIGIFVWVAIGNPIVVLGEVLPIKAIKVFLLYISYPAYLSLLLMCMRKLNIHEVFYPIIFTLVLLTLICLLELLQQPYAFESLHYSGVFPYFRIRLLTKEASWTTLLIYNYFILSIFYGFTQRNKLVNVISIICGVILSISTSAKSLLIAIAVSIILYFFMVLKYINKKTLISIVATIAIAMFFAIQMMPSLISAFKMDIQEYTSVATRSYSMFLGLIIGCIFPVGVGGAVYLGVFSDYLIRFIGIFEFIPIRFNLSEIYIYANSTTDTAVTVKSGILQYNMLWGICGTLYMIKIFIDISKRFKNLNMKFSNFMLMAFWCNIIMTIISSPFTFEFWMFVGVIIYFYEVYLKKINSKEGIFSAG